MNFLDEILQEIVKEYEKERNDQEDFRDKSKVQNQTKGNVKNDIINKSDKTSNSIYTTTEFKKGDTVKIIGGEYKALSGKECKFLENCSSVGKVLIQTDQLNRLYVNYEDIELIKKAKEGYEKIIYNEIERKKEKAKFERTEQVVKAILNDGSSGIEYIKENDDTSNTEKMAYYKAKKKQYDKLTDNYLNNIL
ncbi:hypothetical protein ACXAT3_002774 [Clostridium sporogenes]